MTGWPGRSSGRPRLTVSRPARACCQVPGASWCSRRCWPGIAGVAAEGLGDGAGGGASALSASLTFPAPPAPPALLGLLVLFVLPAPRKHGPPCCAVTVGPNPG